MDASKPEKHDVVPATVSAYLNRHHWDQRFAEEEHYEWFKDYSHFRDLILREIEPNASVLEVGCGNSQLCEELYRDGITELTCIDLSPVAAEKMKQRLSSKGFKVALQFFILFEFVEGIVTTDSRIRFLVRKCGTWCQIDYNQSGSSQEFSS